MTDVLRSHFPDVRVPRAVDLDVRTSQQAAGPGPSWHSHAVQFYEASPFLLDEVQRYIGAGLRLGETAIVIATADHRHRLEKRFTADGFDLDDLRVRGQYVGLDAAETLSRFMVEGVPDPERFRETIGRTLAHCTAGGRRVRAFGEMVALLAAGGDFDAALRLERLWNGLQAAYSFSLLCAYPMQILGGEDLAGPFDRLCSEHGRVLPAESYTMLAEPDDRLRAITLLQQKAQSLEAEIAERKRVEQELQSLFQVVASVAIENARLYREAQDAVRQRDDFLAIASHELRTPLTTIRAHAQLMLRRFARDGAVEWSTVERAFGAIAHQTSKMTRLTEQLLDVSRLDSGKLTLERQITDLGDLVQRVVSETIVQDGRQIDVRAARGIRAWVDPIRLDQLLTSLLDNAIRYGPENARIEVELTECSAGQVQISVRDHGGGIPAEKRGHVFERFFQAHAEAYRSGMGLGLYISREIVELHGGTITFEFPPDGGTRFVVRLPLVTAAPTPPEDSVTPR